MSFSTIMGLPTHFSVPGREDLGTSSVSIHAYVLIFTLRLKCAPSMKSLLKSLS